MNKQGLKASDSEIQCRTGPQTAGTKAKGQAKSQKAVLRWREVSCSPGNAASAQLM